MELSPFGIVGLETAFPLLHTHFVQKGIITLKQLIDWMTVKPSEAFNLPFGTLKAGGDADFTLIDLEKKETIQPGSFLSKGKNTPFSKVGMHRISESDILSGSTVWNGGGSIMNRQLILEDGTIFIGEGFGANGETIGEVVFNTSMTGYQEILSDPSYCGQFVTMTYPLIGNYGVNRDDFESISPAIKAFIVRESADFPSNWRNESTLR